MKLFNSGSSESCVSEPAGKKVLVTLAKMGDVYGK